MAHWPWPTISGPDASGKKPRRSEFNNEKKKGGVGERREATDSGKKEEKIKAEGTYAGFLFLCHTRRGNTNHVLPFTEHQKCYRAFVITSRFQQIGNNFSKYGLVSQSWMGSPSFRWEHILACCSIYVNALSETQNVLSQREEEKKYLFLPYTLA